MYIEVPDSIFLNRWWEVAMRLVCFLLGMSYAAVFGQIFSQEVYISFPLMSIAVGILLGRHVAIRKQNQYQKKKAIAEIMEFEMQHQREEKMRIELAAKRVLENELDEAKRALRQALIKLEEKKAKD